MKSKRLWISRLWILVWFVSGVTTNGQTGINPALANALQNSINTLKNTYQVKGISAAAFIPHQGIWKGVTGISHGTTNIDTMMLFSIGSITKTFVASEIFKLIESNQLALDDSLYKLLPPMTHVDGNITVRQLLGHKSGLSDYLNANWQNAMFNDYYRVWYGLEPVDSFIVAPSGTPGGPWGYVNANYALLGGIIEAKKSDSLHLILRNDFLTPVGMNNTHMEIFETYPNAIPHNWSAPNMNPALATDESVVPHPALWSSVEAAGGYFADPTDLVKWGYNLYSGNVLSQTSLNNMLTFTNVSSSYFNGYGLGSMRFTGNAKTYWGHAGNYFGYAACMLYYPQDSVCVAVLINQDCIAANIAKPLINIAINNLTTNIEQFKGEQTIMMYPNPSSGQVRIETNTDERKQLTILDVYGNLVFENYLSDDRTLDLDFLSNGVYNICIKSGGETITKKLTIVK